MGKRGEWGEQYKIQQLEKEQASLEEELRLLGEAVLSTQAMTLYEVQQLKKKNGEITKRLAVIARTIKGKS